MNDGGGGMRRTRWMGLLMATVVLGMLASTPALGAGSTGTATPSIQKGPWHGTSDQGLPVDFDVVRANGGLVVEPQDVEVLVTCEITGDQLQLGFGGGQLPIHRDGSFKMRDFDAFFGDLRWSGTLGDTTGTGSISYTVPGLLKDHTLQLCPSGVVPWQAQAGGPGSSRVTAHPDYFIHLWRDRSGHLTWSVTKG